MKLSELVADWVDCDSIQEITGISLDSRAVKSGEVFIALAGAEKYIPQAIKAGAGAVVFDAATNLPYPKDLEGLEQITLVGVNDLSAKLANIAARYYGYPTRYLDIIGITGTNGKTSCSQFLAQVLTDSIVIGTLGWGTTDNLIVTGYTTPDVVQMQKILAESVRLGKKNVVMEVSSHGLQEQRVAHTHFKGAVFTNLSRDHLDYHGSMEDYFQAKLQLFKRPELEFAVINADDAYAQEIIAELNPTVALWQFRTGSPLEDCQSSPRNVHAQNINCSASGIRFDVHCNGETVTINSRLYGEFNVENMLAVLTTLLALGFSSTDAADKVSNLKPVIGRMEHFGGGLLPSVFVDYAHTPDALEKLLLSVKKHNPRNISLVFGCGGNRDTGKRAMMGQIATQLADKVIVTDDNPRFEAGDDIVSDILTGCQSDEVNVIRDRALAIQTAILQADKNDCVVIAGKGHEDYQEIKGVKMPFSDQAVVKQALSAKSDLTGF